MTDKLLIFNSETGKPEGLKDAETVVNAFPKPFATIWRDSTETKFTTDTVQTIQSRTENDQVGFHKFGLSVDKKSVFVRESGLYRYVFRTQMNKNDAGDDTGITTTKVVVNGNGRIGLAVNWALFADGTAPGDDSNVPNDKTKSGLIKLHKDDIINLVISSTLGNDVYGQQLSLEYAGPITLDLSGA